MFDPFNYPWIVLGVSVLSFWAAARIGVSIQKWRRSENEARRDDFTLLIGATLTLLGLIIGFTFSMAVERYDQRKNLDEEEANAIGTEYVRANLLPAADAEKLRGMLKNYLDQRIAVYSIPDSQERRQVMTQTAKLQNELWSAVQAPAMAQPQAAAMLILSGMNDVIELAGIYPGRLVEPNSRCSVDLADSDFHFLQPVAGLWPACEERICISNIAHRTFHFPLSDRGH
jgi:hypothetical protein